MPPQKRTITIGIEDGLVQWITGIPEDMQVVVSDYDVEGAEDTDLTLDGQGNPCFRSVWTHEDENP